MHLDIDGTGGGVYDFFVTIRDLKPEFLYLSHWIALLL